MLDRYQLHVASISLKSQALKLGCWTATKIYHKNESLKESCQLGSSLTVWVNKNILLLFLVIKRENVSWALRKDFHFLGHPTVYCRSIPMPFTRKCSTLSKIRSMHLSFWSIHASTFRFLSPMLEAWYYLSLDLWAGCIRCAFTPKDFRYYKDRQHW